MNHVDAVRAGVERLWVVTRIDMQTGEQETVAIDARDNIRSVAASRNGRSIAVLGEAGVYRYDWPSGRRSGAVNAWDTSVRKPWCNLLMAAVFTDDLETAFILTQDCEVERWDLTTGRTVRLFDIDPKYRYSNAPMRLLLPPGDMARVFLIDQCQPPTLTVISTDNSSPPMQTNCDFDSIGDLAQTGLPLMVIPFPMPASPNVPSDLEMVCMRDGQRRNLKGAFPGVWSFRLTVLPEQRWILGEPLLPKRDVPVWDAATGEYACIQASTGGVPITSMVLEDHRIVRVYANASAAFTPYHIDIFDLPDR